MTTTRLYVSVVILTAILGNQNLFGGEERNCHLMFSGYECTEELKDFPALIKVPDGVAGGDFAASTADGSDITFRSGRQIARTGERLITVRLASSLPAREHSWEITWKATTSRHSSLFTRHYFAKRSYRQAHRPRRTWERSWGITFDKVRRNKWSRQAHPPHFRQRGRCPSPFSAALCEPLRLRVKFLSSLVTVASGGPKL